MLNIMWIINLILPYPAEKLGLQKNNFGGWINGLLYNLIKYEKDIKISIVSIYKGKELREYNEGNISYYLIPNTNNKKQKEYWRIINKKVKPDLVHIHGTEFSSSLNYMESCPNEKVITSIQGLIYRYSDVYLANIDAKMIIKNITFRDILKRDNLFQQKKKFEGRGKTEIEIIRKSNAILGRTTWDYANTKYINMNQKYYQSNEILREKFYKFEWNIDSIERHTIFCSQAEYSIKGFHYLIQSIILLKKKYKDIKVYVAGANILENSMIKSKLRRTGYAKYIQQLVNKFNLKNNIIFTGVLNEEQMIERLLKTHVFVLPSVIENSSNSLGEAMLLGMPCVATNTGGTMDMLEHKKEGYLYPYTEPALCAEYISRIFEDDELAIKLGKEARKKASVIYNPENNVKEIIKIYKEMVGE